MSCRREEFVNRQHVVSLPCTWSLHMQCAAVLRATNPSVHCTAAYGHHSAEHLIQLSSEVEC